MTACPRCRHDPLVPIVYGLAPGRSAEAEAGTIVLGGCAVGPEQWACPACEERFTPEQVGSAASAAAPDDAVRREVARRLDAIEHEHDVRVLYACESGSRAWGFASPDSDYDVRFLYVHRQEWYLSIEPGRDVVELPIEDALDVSGWDLRKALRLLRKANPPLLEWLGSPIVYRERGPTAARLRELARRYPAPRAQAHHYLSMGRENARRHLRGPEIQLKKVLYVLRPLLAVRWLEARRYPVPTELAVLLDTLVPTGPLRAAIDRLLDRKRAAAELATGPPIAVIHDFIESELERCVKGLDVEVGEKVPAGELDGVFVAAVRESWGG